MEATSCCCRDNRKVTPYHSRYEYCEELSSHRLLVYLRWQENCQIKSLEATTDAIWTTQWYTPMGACLFLTISEWMKHNDIVVNSRTSSCWKFSRLFKSLEANWCTNPNLLPNHHLMSCSYLFAKYIKNERSTRVRANIHRTVSMRETAASFK